MRIFERLAKLRPETFRYIDWTPPAEHVLAVERSFRRFEYRDVNSPFGGWSGFNFDLEKCIWYYHIDDLILIAEKLGAKIWAEPSVNDEIWLSCYDLGKISRFVRNDGFIVTSDTQRAAYLASLDAVIAERENNIHQ